MLKYRALHEKYRGLIAAGAYGPGERLPSLRAVARTEGVGLNTARAAFDFLERDGLVRPRERGGYYVRAGTARPSLAGYVAPAGCHRAEGLSTAQKIAFLLERGGPLSGFALAEPDSALLPLARLGRLYASLSGDWISYGNQAGEDELRRRITATYHPYHGSLSPEDILVTNGATEAIGLVCKTLVRPGDIVAVESPTYYDYFRQLTAVGAKVLEIPVIPGRGMDLDLLESELSANRVRMIIVQPNVQNPTGAIMPDADKARLLGLARKGGSYLVQDDVYGDLAFARERPANLDAFGEYEGFVYISSFSKTLAPGLRIGWMKAPGLRRELAQAKSLVSLATNRPAQSVLAAYLAGASYRRHLSAMRASLAGQLADYLEVLATALPPGSSYLPPAGGCLLWVALPEGSDASLVFERAAAEGILAAPGALFSDNPFFRGHLRINFGYRLTERRRAQLARLCSIARGGRPAAGGAPPRG